MPRGQQPGWLFTEGPASGGARTLVPRRAERAPQRPERPPRRAEQNPKPRATRAPRRATTPARTAVQLPLALPPAPPADPLQLARRLAPHFAGNRVTLVVTDNRHTMISVRRLTGEYRVRVHRMFLEASDEVVAALARYILRSDRQASRVLGSFIDARSHRIRRPGRRRVVLNSLGVHHDLAAIYDDLNDRYFGGRVNALITWGRRSRTRRRRASIKMGSYSMEERIIRIHPALDQAFVPRYFVAWIVYHEMLHQVSEVPIVDGRRRFHTPEFLAREQQFEHYEAALRWERDNLERLLCG